MSKIFFLVVITFCTFQSKGQTIFDPTVVYDTMGQLFDQDAIETIEITFYDGNYHDSLSAWWFSKNETRLAATLDFNGIHFDSVAVKYKGNSTFFIANQFNNPKVPYNIDVNDYVGGQQLLGYKKLKLGNALFDPSFSKEALASYVYNQYIPSHQTSLVKLIVNGSYLGVYTNTESISKQFLKKHFNEKNGAFYKCEPSAQYGTGEVNYPADLVYRGTDTLQYNLRYERKSDSAWTNLIEFIDVLNNNPANIESVLNVDRVLWYFAINTVILNEDTYNTMYLHNYYLYQLDDGRFQVIPWDLSESFCGALLGNLNSYDDHYHRDPNYGLIPFDASRPLIYQLLNNPEYRKVYYAHINTIIQENTNLTDVRNWVNNLQNIAGTAVLTDPNKLFANILFPYNVDSVIVATPTIHIGAIMETLRHRIPYLNGLAYLADLAPTITDATQNLELPLINEDVYITAKIIDATSVQLMTTVSVYNSGFLPTVMLDDGLNGDLIAGDSIYTALVPHQNSLDHVKYYIKADNGNTVKLQPQRAEYFYYHYTVDAYLSVEPDIDVAEVNLYPNPASAFVNIDLTRFSNQIRVTIYDINGRKVIENSSYSNQNITLSVSELENGIYMFHVSDGEKSVLKKVIVNH
jgi:hypothetical protein